MNRLVNWVVAYNPRIRSWSEGGDLSEYDPQHWDRFVVLALGRESARKHAQAQRRVHNSLPPRQALLLASLRATHRERAGAAPFEITPPELVELPVADIDLAQTLARKGLVVADDAGPNHVRLTVSAFNRIAPVVALEMGIAAA